MIRLGAAALALAAVILTNGCGRGVVGFVDTRRVLNESVRALEYQKQLNDREKQMVAELAVLAPQVSRTELQARRARLVTELGQMQRDLEGQLNQQLSQVAGQVAKEQGLRLVVTRAPVAFGGRDITQQVIDRLK